VSDYPITYNSYLVVEYTVILNVYFFS